MDIQTLKNNRSAYNVHFEIDMYKRAYLQSRICNGYIINNKKTFMLHGRKLSKKLMDNTKLMKKIILCDINSLDEFDFFSRACAILQSDILVLLNKCTKKANKETKKTLNLFISQIKFSLEYLFGKTAATILTENHAGIILNLIIGFLLVYPALLFIQNDIPLIVRIVVILAGIISGAIIAAVKAKYAKQIAIISLRYKTKNKYTYANSRKTQSIYDTVSKTITDNLKFPRA